MLSFNIFCIDLTQFSSQEELQDFLISTSLERNIDAKIIFDFKNGVYTNGEKVNFAWFDAVTYCVTAYRTETESKFVVELIDYMNQMEPLQYGAKVKQSNPYTIKMKSLSNIDEILDKINLYGMNSLTKEELDVLKSN